MAVANANAEPETPENLPVAEANGNVPVPVENEQINAPAEVEEEDDDSNVIVKRFRSLSRPRQIQLILSVAATIAMMVVIFLWSADPNYQLLYRNLSNKAAGDIVQVLKQQNVDYKLDETNGEVKVPADQLHATRIMLASQGLPKTDEAGFEMLDKQQGFGTSQFMEKARYHRALEGELARSISNLDAVDYARVHLAIPKQSVFIRDRRPPSASVMVNLFPGKVLGETQISSVVHLVASSIPDLTPGKVTVVDQQGKLLSKKELSGEMALSTAQFDYKRKLEDYYISRIERILMPIVGFEGVRSQVDAEIDFTIVEQTTESFNPDLPALRSEHTISQESRGGDLGGVPGALTNQPPGVATVPEENPGKDGQAAGGSPSQKSRQETFNYELDKTISHSRQSTGTLSRLSVAVVVDDKIHFDEDANLIRTPLAPEEINRLSTLIKDAVGFNASRGDSINVINASFQTSQAVPPPPKLPIWEQPWVKDIAKQGASIIFILIVIILVLRPVIRELTYKEVVEEVVEEEMSEEEIAEAAAAEAEAKRAEMEAMGGLSSDEWAELGITHEDYENMLRTLKEMAADDPRIVAQVIKTWVALDEDG